MLGIFSPHSFLEFSLNRISNLRIPLPTNNNLPSKFNIKRREKKKKREQSLITLIYVLTAINQKLNFRIFKYKHRHNAFQIERHSCPKKKITEEK